MQRVIVWDTFGRILKTFKNISDAEDWIDECEHEVLDRTSRGNDVNILVIESV